MEIKSVTLHTESIKEMRKFYVDSFGFPLINEDENSFRIVIGSNELEFTSEDVKGKPYYHFAFNIPSNKFDEAKSWVKERVSLNVEDGEDEADFSHLPAHALYFYDPAGNIVEFISRHSISEEMVEPFSADKGVLNISEIGLTVDDAIDAGERLIDIGIHERDNSPLTSTTLNFMGDSSKGIFIILTQPERKWIFSDKLSAIYPLEIITTNNDRIAINSNNLLEVNKNDDKK
ncbi:Glyoxalase/Bleomycin resistance protein/Dioxygenase superfamily protein [Virgibacillus subterraneus]|uniref:Glyoxalase/Bleomycin resistance protein/Dioxygenase superfamily protein n=2 Tax=Virgibacillus TaxID=84406 RepID=A0A1H1DZQ3_9BACI|nr:MULTISPECIES: VOC family protein [Virgibacillus]SDQ81738.1 Glyoxalase/Bleomycin resistance protein/Dioxygenase superfamily protein [Virgibacillus salinus]SER06724.1 Glyoxalase/Bleomycin resistance protein/Dioxygenase superfamily protein [Virgibacillus subterraneus]